VLRSGRSGRYVVALSGDMSMAVPKRPTIKHLSQDEKIVRAYDGHFPGEDCLPEVTQQMFEAKALAITDGSKFI
jgi:hypothetical protein